MIPVLGKQSNQKELRFPGILVCRVQRPLLQPHLVLDDMHKCKISVKNVRISHVCYGSIQMLDLNLNFKNIIFFWGT